MKFNSITFIIIIIILIYIYCYFIFPSSIQILQTNISDFNFSLLYLRQPIVIPDYLKEKNKLIYSWFNYNIISYDNDNYIDNDNNDNNDDNNYIDNDNNDNNNNDWKQNKHKYLFISALKDSEIIIYKASLYSKNPDENDRIIAIKLEKNQSLIIPFKWRYYIKKRNEFEIWKIDDIITFFLGLFF